MFGLSYFVRSLDILFFNFDICELEFKTYSLNSLDTLGTPIQRIPALATGYLTTWELCLTG